MGHRHARESEAVMTELMMPHHANLLGNVFGGVILSLVDRVASVAAIRHSGHYCVTVSVDKVDFKEPIRIGELVTAYARVNFTGRTSMEVGVKVWQEDRAAGDRKHVASAYLTFVSLDPATKAPRAVAPVLPESAEEKRRFDEGKQRRAHRLSMRK
jgi:acyl-CoA hydrolase